MEQTAEWMSALQSDRLSSEYIMAFPNFRRFGADAGSGTQSIYEMGSEEDTAVTIGVSGGFVSIR